MKKLIVLSFISLYLFSCKTTQLSVKDSDSDRVITVYTDTSYVEEPVLTAYKELVFSQGDTTVIYENEFIIIDGKSYVASETSTWFNVKAIKVYK
jgi:hypothetical protein